MNDYESVRESVHKLVKKKILFRFGVGLLQNIMNTEQFITSGITYYGYSFAIL